MSKVPRNVKDFPKGTALWGDRPSAGNTKNLVGIYLQSIVLLKFLRQREREDLVHLEGQGRGKYERMYHTMQWLQRENQWSKTLIYWLQRSEFKFSRKQFKVDRLQIIVVAKKYIYVSQLFISRMPKLRAVPQLVTIIVYMDFSTEVFFRAICV